MTRTRGALTEAVPLKTLEELPLKACMHADAAYGLLAKGTHVEVKLKPWTRHFKGKVVNCLPATAEKPTLYTVRMVDVEMVFHHQLVGNTDIGGRVIEGVLSCELRPYKPKPHPPRRLPKKAPPAKRPPPKGVKLHEGDVVETKLRGWKRPYAGRVLKVHDQGHSVTMLFDDPQLQRDLSSSVQRRVIERVPREQLNFHAAEALRYKARIERIYGKRVSAKERAKEKGGRKG